MAELLTEPLALTAYVLPEFLAQPDPSWERRLREISPITSHLSHLRFRWRAPQAHWFDPKQGLWEIYSCTPRHLVTPDRAEQFRLHWSELPKDRRAGRRAMVTNYQHYLWHQHGVEARRFWVLQGEWGGTPAHYTRREVRYLDACNAMSEPAPLGFFAPCPFDERAVKAILARDRLIQHANNLDALAAADRPDALRAEDEAAERVFRDRWLDWWYEQIQPQAEFMKSYLRKSESDVTMRKATRAESDAVSQWKDHYREHGSVLGAGVASSRKVQVAVR